MQANAIPVPVITVVADVLAAHYYSHRRLDALFAEAGAPGEPPPDVSCNVKCNVLLKRCNADREVDALAVLGAALTEFMEAVEESELVQKGRERIAKILGRYGLRYEQGGHIRGHFTATPFAYIRGPLTPT